MKYALRIELKRAFKNKYFAAMVILGCALATLSFFTSPGWVLSKSWLRYMAGDEMIIAMHEKLECMDSVLEIWMPRYGFSNRFYYILVMIMPILAAIPYGTSYLNDKKSGLIHQLITRMEKKDYYAVKLIVSFISGGTVAVIPFVFNLMLCMCFLPWGMPIRSTNLYPISNSELVFSNLFYSKPALYVLLYLAHVFVVFGLLNTICLFFVYLEENRFALQLTPFTLYFAGHVFVTFGLNKNEFSIMKNSSLYLLERGEVWIVAVELLTLVLLSVFYMIRSKKDVL